MRRRCLQLLALVWCTIVLVPVRSDGKSETGVSSHQTHPASATSLPVSVDGEQTPELVPDSLAYSHFIMAVAEPTSPSIDQLRTRAALLAPLGLSTTDYYSLVNALNGVREQIDDVERRGELVNGTSSATDLSELDQLRDMKRMVLHDAQNRVVASLSVDGKGRLEKHIREYVKRRIKIYGDTPSF